jgi:hypothetical protein
MSLGFLWIGTMGILLFLYHFYLYLKAQLRVTLIENLFYRSAEEIKDYNFQNYVKWHYNTINDLILSQFAPESDQLWSNDIKIEVIEQDKELHIKLIKSTTPNPSWIILNLEKHPRLVSHEIYLTLY